jgi:hypothetical protein
VKNSLILKGYFEDQRAPLLLLLKWNFSGGGLETEKVLNFTKDAHPRSVSTFEVDEHLQELITGLFAGVASCAPYPGSQTEPAKQIPQPWPSYLKETLTLVR